MRRKRQIWDAFSARRCLHIDRGHTAAHGHRGGDGGRGRVGGAEGAICLALNGSNEQIE